jgi:hypothetical protein
MQSRDGRSVQATFCTACLSQLDAQHDGDRNVRALTAYQTRGRAGVKRRARGSTLKRQGRRCRARLVGRASTGERGGCQAARRARAGGHKRASRRGGIMVRCALAALAGLAAAGLVREADAHARFVCPAPRSPNANKNVGCGADAGVKGPVTEFAPGPNTITFEEFVFHPGSPVRIALSTSGGVTQAAFDTCVLLNHVPHSADVVARNAAGKYSITVDIPDIACNNCVLQLIQVRTAGRGGGRVLRYCDTVSPVANMHFAFASVSVCCA